jgi:cell division protein FtsW (lipid II flippase)
MWALWLTLFSPLLLALLYPLAVQYERGGRCRWLFVFYAVAGLLSTLVNFTWMVVLAWELPRKKEITTSQRCERLVYADGFSGKLARAIARYTNYFDPTPPHIPLPTQTQERA